MLIEESSIQFPNIENSYKTPNKGVAENNDYSTNVSRFSEGLTQPLEQNPTFGTFDNR